MKHHFGSCHYIPLLGTELYLFEIDYRRLSKRIYFFNWYATPGLVLPIRISLVEGCSWQEIYWTKGFAVKDKRHHSGNLSVAVWFGWPVRNIHFTNDNGYLPTVMNTNLFLYRLVRTSIVAIYRLWLLSKTTGATSGTGSCFLFRCTWTHLDFWRVHVTQALFFV